MAGSPLKRQRKLGVRGKDGSVMAFPYMPRVAELPPGWRYWSPAEKIETRVVFMIGVKVLIDGKLGRETAREHNRATIVE